VMLALVKSELGDGHLDLAEVPVPTPRPGWLLIQVAACGICGTDLHLWHGEHRCYPPVVLGHEYTGRVVGAGEGAEDWVGERVVVEQHAGFCGTCDVCRRGLIHLCPSKRPPGWGIDGAFASHLVAPALLAHRVPDDVSDVAATMCEPLAIALTGLDDVGVRAGDTVAVIGPGPVGLLAALAARSMGAERVVVAGRRSSAARLELARELGFEVIDVSELGADSTPAEVVAAADGAAFDVTVETSGAASALRAAVCWAARGGRMASLGLSGGRDVALPFDEAMNRSLLVKFSMSSAYRSWVEALSVLRRIGPDVERLATRYPLRSWRTAFSDVADRRVVKAMLEPEQG